LYKHVNKFLPSLSSVPSVPKKTTPPEEPKRKKTKHRKIVEDESPEHSDNEQGGGFRHTEHGSPKEGRASAQRVCMT